MTTTEKMTDRIWTQLQNEAGVAGYLLLWFLGVPAGLLFVIFLLRGCN